MLKLLSIVFKVAVALIVMAAVILYVAAHTDIPQGVKNEGIKGIEEPSFVSLLLSMNDFKRIKDIGFNTLVVIPPHPVIFGKPRTLPFLSSATALVVKKAHLQGLSVMIVPEIILSDKEKKLTNDRLFRDDVIEISRNWAEFSEKYKVEYLSPLKDPEKIFGEANAITWSLEVLPEIRERFKGKIAAYLGSGIRLKQGKNTVAMFSASMSEAEKPVNIFVFTPEIRGYDFMILSAVPPKEVRNINLYTIDLRRAMVLIKTNSLRSGSGSVIMSGLNTPISPTVYFGEEYGPVVTEKQQAELVSTTLKMVGSSSAGFILTGWSSDGFGIKDREAEKQAREALKSAKE